MRREINQILCGAVIGILGGAYVLLAPFSAISKEEITLAPAENVSKIEWTNFHSDSGNCTMKFPTSPEHISEKMTMPDQGFELSYDAYIASSNKDAMFMLLVAQYPTFVDESYAQMSLEVFLNAILTHNPANQLLFADLSLVNGHEALDFFIRAGGVYFKGRAVMIKNSLYLMAMECQIQNYNEEHFNTFVQSFELSAH